jgi:NitT/TauT family transport system substrate-binding protein/putative hydroxymethylpyrimidine transport system substrate-binding protein
VDVGAQVRRTAAVLGLVVLLVTVAGCGSDDRGGGSDRVGGSDSATVVLDFRPNAVHAGIELAVDRDFDEAEGVALRVQPPSSSADAVKLLVNGRADLAVLDLHDLALARSKGRDLVAVMALVQRPLAAVLAQADVRRPRDLSGGRVGVTGVPSDEAVLRAIVGGDGGDPKSVREVTIGFDAVAALLGRRVDAATAFWNVEGVQLRRRRPRGHVFRLEAYGAPPYPELVLCVTRETLDERRATVRATVRALRRGYQEALADPGSAVTSLVEHGAGDRAEVARELDAVSPVFAADGRAPGTLDRAALRRWADWEAAAGLVDQPPDVDRAFAFGL